MAREAGGKSDSETKGAKRIVLRERHSGWFFNQALLKYNKHIILFKFKVLQCDDLIYIYIAK